MILLKILVKNFMHINFIYTYEFNKEKNMTGGIGYTHALFSSGSYFREIALEVDKEENGGNKNGLIDGNEIVNFTKKIKEKYNFDFSFENINQSEKRTVAIRDENGHYNYNNVSELVNEYAGNGTSKVTIFALNGTEDIFQPKYYSKNTVDISYLDVDKFRKSQEAVEQQEDMLRSAIETREEAEKPQQKSFNELSTWEKIKAYLGYKWLCE